MRSLRVNLGNRSYSIRVGECLLQRAGPILSRLRFGGAPIVVSTGRVLHHHGSILLASLREAFGPVPVIRIGDGEAFKSQAMVEKIHAGLFREHADRRSWIVAFGGGVVGDVAGFAAATFMRGIRYVGIPTTLLAQVDSSVGGKVGINVAQGKNLIGAFHQPSLVFSDTAVLRTLPKRELASGLQEVIKCGAIRSVRLVEFLEKNLPSLLAYDAGALAAAVLAAVRIKAQIVSEDERESGMRLTLNFGHTLGHALEAATDYRKFRHGEAVAWGMIAAIGLSRELTGLPDRQAARLERLIRSVGRLPSLRGISPARVWGAMLRDKKSREGTIRMILLPELGRTEVVGELSHAGMQRFVADFLVDAGSAKSRNRGPKPRVGNR